MGVFSQHAPDYIAAGLAVFPVDTQHKRPAVRNWQRAGMRATRAWQDKFGDADGLGLCMGERSRLVEVDVDMAGEAALAEAVERFGETPAIICTPSGKWKMWYRHDGEGRRIRPIKGLSVDILGSGGFTIAPPSYRPDLGRSYGFVRGSVADLDRLPTIWPGALGVGRGRAAEAVREGERNNVLWRWCMTTARFCDDDDQLIDAAQTWAEGMPVPLDPREVERAARSAWRFQIEGRNFVGLHRPQLHAGDIAMDDLSDATDAFYLLLLFQRYHRNRTSFFIKPDAMALARNPPWGRRRIERARDVLIERGHVEVLRAPNARTRTPGLYRLRPATAETTDYHLTPFSPALLAEGRRRPAETWGAA